MLKGINQNQQTLLNELILKMKDNLEEKMKNDDKMGTKRFYLY